MWRGVQVVLRLLPQQPAFFHGDARKTHVQFRPELVGRQQAYLVQQQLPRVKSLLRDLQNGLRLQRAEITDVDLQQNLFTRGAGVLIFRLRLKSGTGREIRRAPKIGDELAGR